MTIQTLQAISEAIANRMEQTVSDHRIRQAVNARVDKRERRETEAEIRAALRGTVQS